MADQRRDEHLGTVVHIVGERQGRPNLPAASGCPFCPGGVEAPDAYDVRWFPNRWPAMADDRCEVVLYTPQHDATLASLGVEGVRRVIELWAARTTALGARANVEYVLVFENRGAEVGATIAHPHGQIYAYDHVPQRPARLLAAAWTPDPEPGERLVASVGDWDAVVPHAAIFPIAVQLAPRQRIPDLPALDDAGRSELAALLIDICSRLDRLYGQPLPYMLWINQRPTDGGEWPQAWCSIEIVSPWRAAGVPRYLAAAEVGAEEYFNPVAPEATAAALRAVGDR